MSALARRQREFLGQVFAEGEPADARIAVYRRNVLGNLCGALREVHPVVARLVGPAFFREAAERFARATPSTSGDLHEFGAGFAAFLAAYPHAASLPYLADVARLEWALHEAHHAADAAPFDFAALARVPEAQQGRLRFQLHPATRLLRSAHPVLALWEANQPDRDGTPERTSGADHVLVSRDAGVVRPVALGPAAWEFLSALAAGVTLEAAFEAAPTQSHDELARALSTFAAESVLAGFEIAAAA